MSDYILTLTVVACYKYKHEYKTHLRRACFYKSPWGLLIKHHIHVVVCRFTRLNMLPIQHIQKGSHTANTGLALKTGLAFRPFFWLGAVFLLLSLALWSLFWQGSILVSPYGGMLWWHQHEMLFGFTAAIVAGFLLTAVQNWTGLPSLSG